MFRLSFLLVLILPFLAHATPYATRAEMERQMDVLHAFYESTYAPKDFKEQEFHWSLEQEVEAAKASIRFNPNISLKDFHRLVKRFISSMNDYHVRVFFFSTEKAFLPFRVKSAEGSYFITAVDSKRLSTGFLTPQPGDELLLFDGKPVGEVVGQLLEEERQANPLTDQALAEMALTQRSGADGHIVPKGLINLSFRSKQTGKVHTAQMMWDYSPELIANGAFPSPILEEERPLDRKRLGQQFLAPQFTTYWKQVKKEGWKECDRHKDLNGFGFKKSFLPSLGPVLWSAEKSSPFHSYIFECAGGKKVGFVRISRYAELTEEKFKANVQSFEAIIERMEKETDALVIDQMNNPGGSPFYMYALLSTLTDQPLDTPKDRIKLNQSILLEHYELYRALQDVETNEEAAEVLGGEGLCGYPADFQTALHIRDFIGFMIKQWEEGKRLSDEYFLYALDKLNPSGKARYTKPILMLINELCFSAGDYAPAVLQDNKRVTLMGTRTAGAGGAVYPYCYPNHLGIARLSTTWTLSERASGEKIENRGVTPDIPYQLTIRDLTEDFIDFKEMIHLALSDMLNTGPSEKEETPETTDGANTAQIDEASETTEAAGEDTPQIEEITEVIEEAAEEN